MSNHKPAARKGNVQLIDASGFWQKMRKSLGNKRKELSDKHIAEITRLFGKFIEAKDGKKSISRIFRNEEFGYSALTVERPQRDAKGKVVLNERGKTKGKPQPDSDLTGTEALLIYDIATGRTVDVNVAVDGAFSRGGVLWWSTGDQDTIVWHTLDLRTV